MKRTKKQLKLTKQTVAVVRTSPLDAAAGGRGQSDACPKDTWPEMGYSKANCVGC